MVRLRRSPPVAETCVYCAERSATTKDHVPPQAFFAEEFRTDQLEIPSCLPCNNGASKDDELLRTYLTFCVDAHDDVRFEEVKAASDRALFWTPGRDGLRRRIANKLTEVHVHTESGLELKVGAAKLESKRVAEVISRVVRGLVHHHLGRLPLIRKDIHVIFLSGFGPKREFELGVFRTMEPTLTASATHQLAGGCFKYRFVTVDEMPTASFWHISFYDKMAFGAIVSQD